MSKFCVTVIAVVLVTALSSAATAKQRGHFGLGPLGTVKSAFARVLAPGLFRGPAHHRRVHVRRAKNAPVALKSAPVALQNIPSATSQPSGEEELVVGRLFTDPAARRQIAATAALAHYGDRSTTNGWWSHGHDGYGWVGPLFWPFAYNDILGYAIFGDGMGFWDYGYPDIYAGVFGPYGSDELAAYMAPPSSGRGERRTPPLQQLCGDAGREITGLAIDQIQRVIQPTEAQRAALDRLADASNSAAQVIQATCPTQPASTAPARLALMQQRTAAILSAVISLQPLLWDLYDLLNDEQKARLNALADDQLKTASANGAMKTPAQGCEASLPTALQWPAGEIEARLHPTDAQRSALERMQRASARAVEMLSYECQPPKDAITLPDRLAAVDGRLGTMQQAINLVSDALEDFYSTLSDEQKFQFELIGQKRAP
ncbi:Spy/CpxP family protein refolding chaperone [Bradyrhizobium sp. WSM 1738]|uniref:Spy/CpxP family protein refolding chaperone n=1 Tax=Bradyrhizobium hereditatis TaxID=2821405 RepID=UPI001CE35B58|nr:Spy/CpxP family protein refolding chaperone [Bradyrhizobium hereditatis]MCA6114035.1 Spy/CpxP family protein refolding chaperone [Bradyrhizobium hereditatis]